MPPRLFVLCYHRVLDPTRDCARGWPYFARGTAVSTASFARQLETIAAEFHVVPPGAAERGEWPERRDRPLCWITFDDGYREVFDRARPTLAGFGMRATAFVTACTLHSPPTALPADRWYAALTSATRPRGELRSAEGRWRFDLDDPGDRARMVDGPERRAYLHARPQEQAVMLEHLREALGASANLGEELYLSTAQMRELLRDGWSVGAHGATHAIFPSLDDRSVEQELEAIEGEFLCHGLPPPRSFAWPDGAVSARAARSIATRGYASAVALGNIPADASDRWSVSRYVVPDDADWVERVLLPLARG